MAGDRQSRAPGRVLFVTLGHVEATFYDLVGRALERQGWDVGHVTYSRRSAQSLQRAGRKAWCFVDLVRAVEPCDWGLEADRIVEEYGLRTIKEIYRTDFVCDGKAERESVERTVRHVVAMERLLADWRADVVVPEVGNETIRTAAHLAGQRSGAAVLFLLYTIFPHPLRLTVASTSDPIVEPDMIRELDAQERDLVEAFIADYIARDTPIRAARTQSLSAYRIRMIVRHFAMRWTVDHDNEYLRPCVWAAEHVREAVRVQLSRPLYGEPPTREPYVYFPLHVVDDYKIKRLLPHLADQASVVELLAAALPRGYKLVVKEHPMSIGRTSLTLLRRLRRTQGVVVVAPQTGSQSLIAGAAAIAVISSTVGLEALLHAKPVLTMGHPFYSGTGLTVDVDGTEGIVEGVARLLRHEVDRERMLQFVHAAMHRCRPGAPVTIDRSLENATRLARSIHEGALAARRDA